MGLLHKEAVGKLITQEQFIQAVSFSSVLPGSEAEKLAMFIGLRVAGLPGALMALLGASLPPTVMMLGVVIVLHRLRREEWVKRFVNGLMPAVAVLMVYVAYMLLTSNGSPLLWQVLVVAAVSLVAFLYNVPPPVVLVAAGIFGIFFFK